MQEDIYHDMAESENRHWWFTGRKKIIFNLLKQYLPKGPKTILEVGCGTGGNLSMLNQFGHVSAMEMNSFALQYAAQKSGVNVKQGWLPDNIPFENKFDVICMFDVLEHVNEDQFALKKIIQFVKKDGFLILTVPAYQWLYGPHDQLHHHFRRYSVKRLKSIIPHRDVEIIRLTHYNCFLLPLLLLTRFIDKIFKPEISMGFSTPNQFLNRVLYSVFVFERYLLGRINFPFGSSIFMILKK